MSVSGLRELSRELKLDYTTFMHDRVKYWGQRKSIDLSGLNLQTLPKSLKKIDQLIGLNCKFNRISDLPKYIENLNLRSIDLSFNNINEIHDTLLLNDKLKELNLGGNNIQEVDINPSDFNGLYKLNLEGNRIERCKIDNNSIRDIEMSKNPIKSIEIIGESVTILRLQFTPIEVFPIIKCNQLRLLNCYSSFFSEIAERNFNFPQLEELILSVAKVEVIYPNLIKETTNVKRVYINFRNQINCAELMEKINALNRIIGNRIDISHEGDIAIKWVKIND